MKVSIDGILGTARKINSQKDLAEKGTPIRAEEGKTDSLSISSRINGRLDGIEAELREIQASLAKNQTVRDGIEQLNADRLSGGARQGAILDAVTYEGRKVLREFVGDSPTDEVLAERGRQNADMIREDVTRLKKLQVELDNITASNLVGDDRLSRIVSNVESVFTGSGPSRIDQISELRPDAVMRLIR